MGREGQSAWRGQGSDVEGCVVVHADDSLFTGRTHAGMRRTLRGRPAAVYLAALTLDVNTPCNHPDELRWAGRQPAEQLVEVESLIRASDGRLGPATSMWARRKGWPASKSPEDREMESVTRGSDRLLAELWRRFDREIRHG